MQKFVLILSVLAVVVMAGCVSQQSPNQREFGNQTLTFRSNLADAAAVPVYPNESVLLQTLEDPKVSYVYIAYIPNDTENGLYAMTGFELSYKLVAGYKAILGAVPSVTAMPLNGTPSQPARDGLIIWMRGSGAGANQTAVTVDNGIITVEGPSSTYDNRTVTINKQKVKYSDLELAADKLLMVFLRLE